ncbi:MAG: L-histidine N(alpha)-methyltransferase [Alphaproteobacteria bacterium]|nr:MAG: L-histidine N(alpha)-methyltransferase [Alphaproteobacteria bacterium]
MTREKGHAGKGAMELVNEVQRFQFTRLARGAEAEDGADVVAGLTSAPKTLPCRYFYDAAGSDLFAQICETPEYYPTRTERSILTRHAGEIAALTGPCEIVELGSGTASKTRLLLDAYADGAKEVHFVPIDVSESVLRESSRDLVSRYAALSIRGYSGTYEQALAALHPAPAPARMFVFLGSTIGNFRNSERVAFVARIRDAMEDGDTFLLGIDRRKDGAIIEAAYNDSQGLTARFNLNMLSHLNRRFHGDLVVDNFTHRAVYEPRRHQIEMRLESRVAQTARLADLNLSVSFARGESIRTEISKKFDPEELAGEFTALGLGQVALWSDARQWFSLVLFRLGAR